MDITWEEPPAYAKRPGQGGSPGRYVKFAVELQKNPGRWALLPAEPTSPKGAEATAHNIRKGKVKGFEADKYETAVDELKIYVRFKAPEEDEPNGDGESKPIREEDGPSRGEIRAWARNNGFQVAIRGAIPKDVLDAYDEAHPQG